MPLLLLPWPHEVRASPRRDALQFGKFVCLHGWRTYAVPALLLFIRRLAALVIGPRAAVVRQTGKAECFGAAVAVIDNGFIFGRVLTGRRVPVGTRVIHEAVVQFDPSVAESAV